MTMSPSTKVNLVKNAHLKSQNTLKLTKNYMQSYFLKTFQFLYRTGCRLTRKSMQENFPIYLRTFADKSLSYGSNDLLSQCRKISLLLRCTSIQSHKVLLQHFLLLSLSLLQKISSGTIDAVTCANALRIEGKISEDVSLIFDEMYLQKSQEYFWEKWLVVMTKENCIRA